jgi:N-acetyldiaminopimelate deacetylase
MYKLFLPFLLFALAQAQNQEITMMSPIELRHKLHANPELMFEEFETTRLLKQNIEKIPGVVIHTPTPTGLVIEYTVNSGDYLLFRADIDALPVVEETGIPFASANGKMHACGHDVHTAILYQFLKEVVNDKVKQNLIFVFQPAEEGGGGADILIKTGLLDKFKITKAFALHVNDDFDAGVIASTKGTLFAASNAIGINFTGKQSHVAFPQNGINAFDGLMLFLQKAKATVNSSGKKILFGYGKITSGIARNIVPPTARFDGSLRALKIEDFKWFLDELFRIGIEVENETKVKCEVVHDNNPYVEVTVNDKLYDDLKPALEKDFKFIDCGSRFTGEDFGFFSKKYPSFMFWLGTSKGERFGLHTPQFLPGDDIIALGARAFRIILNQQTEENP